MSNICYICGTTENITFHHLIPKTCHSKKWFRKHFTKEDMKTRGVLLCRSCHSFVHRKITEKELGKNHNTIETLMEHEEINKYAAWARKKTKNDNVKTIKFLPSQNDTLRIEMKNVLTMSALSPLSSSPYYLSLSTYIAT